MSNVAQFVFYSETSTERMSNVFGNINEGSCLTLQIDDFGAGLDLNLEVQGATDMNNPNSFYNIKAINLETFKTSKTITKAGIYMIICSGIPLIRMKSNVDVGGFKAFAVSIS